MGVWSLGEGGALGLGWALAGGFILLLMALGQIMPGEDDFAGGGG